MNGRCTLGCMDGEWIVIVTGEDSAGHKILQM
jgi:hypothetical protein